MADVLTPEQRRLNMSRIKGRNTALELRVRQALHSRGFRFRLHVKELPGRPDIVLPRWRTGIFVHGCFWHGHGCHLLKLPATRTAFWRNKIAGTIARDRGAVDALLAARWRVLIIWECALRGPTRRQEADVIEAASAFLYREGAGNLCEIQRKPRKRKMSNPLAAIKVFSSRAGCCTISGMGQHRSSRQLDLFADPAGSRAGPYRMDEPPPPDFIARIRGELESTLARARDATRMPWRDLTAATLAELRFNSIAGWLPPDEAMALRDAFAQEMVRLWDVVAQESGDRETEETPQSRCIS